MVLNFLRKYTFVLLIFFLLLGLVLRLVDIERQSLYGDELTLVYDAYSILETGYSQTGQFLPLVFDTAGGRPPVYVYLSVPFVAVFGPTILATRILSILSGLGLILLVFYLGKRLLNKEIGLIAAMLVSISPWDIHLSRGGFESHLALFLATFGVTTLLYSREKIWLMIVSFTSFTLAMHTYSTFKLTIPILLFSWFMFDRSLFIERNRKKIFIVALSFAIIYLSGLLIINNAVNLGAESRFLSINILNQHDLRESIIQKVIHQRDVNLLPSYISWIFHNRYTEYTFLVGENYLSNFSISFLFTNGDKNPRHNSAVMGELFIVEIVFIILGLTFLIKNNPSLLKLLISWILIVPLPTALIGEPHALRNSLFLPPLILLSATGFFYLIKIVESNKKYWVLFIFLSLLLAQFIIFSERFFFVAPNQYSRFWAYPAKLASEFIVKNKGNVSYIIVSDRLDNIEFAYPVYGKIPPSLVISQNKEKSKLNGYLFKKFDNVYIGALPMEKVEEFLNSLDGKAIYIGPIEDKFKVADSVVGRDGLRAFIFLRKNR